jgi:ABC-type histidine transport system ATPase subunit
MRGKQMPDRSEETADLLATVEEVRKERYPDLDPELVSEILQVQHQFAEDHTEARKRTEQIVNRWVSQRASAEGVI